MITQLCGGMGWHALRLSAPPLAACSCSRMHSHGVTTPGYPLARGLSLRQQGCHLTHAVCLLPRPVAQCAQTLGTACPDSSRQTLVTAWAAKGPQIQCPTRQVFSSGILIFMSSYLHDYVCDKANKVSLKNKIQVVNHESWCRECSSEVQCLSSMCEALGFNLQHSKDRQSR